MIELLQIWKEVIWHEMAIRWYRFKLAVLLKAVRILKRILEDL